jgi:hypothetical protein
VDTLPSIGMVSNAQWEAASTRLVAAENELGDTRAEMDRLNDLHGISYSQARAEVLRGGAKQCGCMVTR